MNYIKQFSFVTLLALCLNYQLEAFKWQDLKQSVYQFIDQYPKTTLAIAVIVAASLYYLTTHHDFQTADEALNSDDAPAFIQWAHRQLKQLESEHKKLLTQQPSQERQNSIDYGFRLAGEIRLRLNELINRYAEYAELASSYGTGNYNSLAAQIINFQDPIKSIQNFLGIKDLQATTFEQFKQVLESRRSNSRPGSPEHWACRQINFCGESPFGWQTFIAYSQGKDYFNRLPRIPREKLEPLLMRALIIKDSYNLLNPTET